MLNENFISIYDVFSDEEDCPNCQYGKYELYNAPSLCWECYDKLIIDSLENEWLFIDSPILS